LISSADGGNTWTVPHVVNDDNTVNSHFQVRMAVDQTSGVVGLQWLDCRQDPTDGQVLVYTTFTNDGGHSCTTNTTVAANPQDFSAAADPNDFLEYNGFAIFNNVAYYSWADNSFDLDNATRIFFDKVVIDPGIVNTGGTGGGRDDRRYEPNNTSNTAYNLG